MQKRYQHIFTPARLFVLSFLFLVLLGTALLVLPVSANGRPLSFVDAFFSSTSAVCVTGLTVIDLGSRLSLFGKIVTFVLFQLGGLGIVTFAVLFFEILGKNISTANRDVVQQNFLPQARADLFRVVHWVLIFTFTFQLVGALLLFVRFKALFPLWDSIGYAFYHSASAFNNCGYALFPESLTLFRSDLFVNLVVMTLIFLGGIGFYFLYESMLVVRRRGKLSLNSRIVLVTSLLLIVVGTLLLLFFESNNQLADLGFREKLLRASFQSVTSRTCGFNTINIGAMTNASILILMLLMFVGASSGSTGGGIKTSSFAVIMMLIKSSLRGESNLSISNRTVSREIVHKTVALVFSAIVIIIVALALLIFFADDSLRYGNENRSIFLSYLFEVISAFGTVGLSMGATMELNLLQKIVIIVTMFIGRVGPLTFVYSLQTPKKSLTYAEEKIMVG